jgi:hypothetical protein
MSAAVHFSLIAPPTVALRARDGRRVWSIEAAGGRHPSSTLLLVAGNGYRAIAHDRRGGGRSDQPAQGNEDLSAAFYGANREGSEVSKGVRDQFWRLSMQVGLLGAMDCIDAFLSDFREDLKKIDVPIDVSGRLTVEQIPDATLKV